MEEYFVPLAGKRKSLPPVNAAIAACRRQASGCTLRGQLPELKNQILKFNWNLTPFTPLPSLPLDDPKILFDGFRVTDQNAP